MEAAAFRDKEKALAEIRSLKNVEECLFFGHANALNFTL
jgi:hypothetical protein